MALIIEHKNTKFGSLKAGDAFMFRGQLFFASPGDLLGLVCRSYTNPFVTKEINLQAVVTPVKVLVSSINGSTRVMKCSSLRNLETFSFTGAGSHSCYLKGPGRTFAYFSKTGVVSVHDGVGQEDSPVVRADIVVETSEQ